MTLKLGGVASANGGLVGGQPFGQVGAGAGRLRGDQQASGEAVDFVTGEDDVTDKAADETRGLQGQFGGNREQRAGVVDGVTDEGDHIFEGEDIGPDGIPEQVFGSQGGLDGQLGQVIDKDGLQAVGAITGQGEEGKSAQ